MRNFKVTANGRLINAIGVNHPIEEIIEVAHDCPDIGVFITLEMYNKYSHLSPLKYHEIEVTQ